MATIAAVPTLLIRRADAPSCPTAVMPLLTSTAGGSGAFLVLADDNKRYWCKCIQSPQGPRVCINEQIVGRVAMLIGAATCPVSIVRIPAELADWEFRPGHRLVPGYVHGSLAVEGVTETRALQHRNDDDNANRYTTLGILADWCWGSDPQWLYAPADENRYTSHDHGHYFPNGPNWTAAALQANDAAAQGPSTAIFLPMRDERTRALCDLLEAVTLEKLAETLGDIPSDWPITNDELVEMVNFLDRRRQAVAARLRLQLPPLGGPP